jgi:hypothetical protein
MLKLWEHLETKRRIWRFIIPGDLWYSIPICYEDELPKLTDSEYSNWFKQSHIIDGVRIGPNPEYVALN